MVVGLGNPGKEYEATRHNAGFMVVDEAVRSFGLSSWKKKDNALQIYDTKRQVVFVKPLSFMNLSGAPVRVIASWYRTPPESVLAIVDDMDLAFGTLRMRPFGGHGGHNGLRSMIATLGEGFPRLRIGVGRPAFESIDHVLSPFTQPERNELPKVIEAAAQALAAFLDDGLEAAMQFANNWSL
ncbi:MAG: aminoacyl-tRNA hydrolase [Vulcanimicrobiaceae bacterium]